MDKEAKKQVQNTIAQILDRAILNPQNLSDTFKLLLDHKLGDANQTSMGAFLAALQMYPLDKNILLSLIRVVLNYDRVEIPYSNTSELCGIIGSGKDELKTFNVSTCAAFVAAGAGVKVVKNGSRSDTSIAGTTDVLETIGINVDLSQNQTIEILEKYGITICDAGNYFPRMSREYVGKVLFINPLSYTLSIASGLKFEKILFGISFKETNLVASCLKDLGIKRAMVVHGTDSKGRRFDEISSVGPTYISELKDNKIIDYKINPEDYGFRKGKPSEITQKSTLAANATLLISILENKNNTSARDIVILNAGALIYLSGIESTYKKAIESAKQSLSSGKALKILYKLKEHSYE